MPFPDPVPVSLVGSEFTLRPITAADTELDYAAVMETREPLRLWRQSTWPEDDFTVEDNRVDLVSMEERHQARRAFNYTVLSPDGTECLGCVYIYATSAKFLAAATVTAVGSASWSEVDAVVFFWVRLSRMETRMDARLLAALRTWFRTAWGLQRTVYVTSEQFTQQVDLLSGTDLTLQFELSIPDEPRNRLAYG